MLLVLVPSPWRRALPGMSMLLPSFRHRGWKNFRGVMPVKFMILIHSNPRSREIWAGFTAAQRAEGLDHYAALAGDLEKSGELIATEALAPPAEGRRLP